MRVCIDPGHGGSDPGASFDGLLEKHVVLDIALRLERMLKPSRNVTTTLSRSVDVTLALGERVETIKDQAPDYVLSIHTNADADLDLAGMPEARGAEIWIHEGGTGRPLAARLAAAIGLEFPDEPWRGIKERGLYVLRMTHPIPAALVEVAFIDASESNRKLKDPNVRDEIAFALMRGVLDL